MKAHIGRSEYSVEVKKYGPKETTVKKHNKLNDAREVGNEDDAQCNKDSNAALSKEDMNVPENVFKTSQNISKKTAVKGKYKTTTYFNQ